MFNTSVIFYRMEYFHKYNLILLFYTVDILTILEYHDLATILCKRCDVSSHFGVQFVLVCHRIHWPATFILKFLFRQLNFGYNKKLLYKIMDTLTIQCIIIGLFSIAISGVFILVEYTDLMSNLKCEWIEIINVY